MLTALLASASSCLPEPRAASAEARPAERASAGAREPADAPRPIEDLLRSDPFIADLVAEAPRRRLQVLFAVPSAGGLERFGFRVDAEYFYPASAVKLCTAVAALEKLEELRSTEEGRALGLRTRLRFADRRRADRSVETTLRAELERSLVMSDNDAYNRLHELVGSAELEARMARLGLGSARLSQKLVSAEGAPLSIAFRLPGGDLELPPRAESRRLPVATGRYLLGDAHVDERGRLVDAPMDFSERNEVSLADLQSLLVAVARPDLVDAERAPKIAPADREALVEILARLPSDLDPRNVQPGLDDFAKPFHRAFLRALPGHDLRVVSKGGRAYGFTVGNAYVADRTTGRELFVAFAVYTNVDETLNDDRYDYLRLGNPFVQRLATLAASRFLAAP